MKNLKKLTQFSKSLSALYVEDDKSIRDNYEKIFSEIFLSIDIANDGQEGLEKFQTGHYDLIITDINMPKMNGIDMIKNIFEKNEDQMIVVTSAHDESKYLLQLIDLGIERFLIKPVDFTKMIAILYRSCKRLVELKELREYQSRIEEENLNTASLIKELKTKNIALEKEIRKKTQKENVNLTLIDGMEHEKEFTEVQLEFYAPHINPVSALDFVTHFSGNIDALNDELEKIEEDLERCIHQKLSSPTKENVNELSSSFHDYAVLLDSAKVYTNLAQALRHLSSVLSKIETYSLLKDMKSYLYGIANSLHKVRSTVMIEKNSENIHFLDQSIIGDCFQAESFLIKDTHAEGDLDDLFFEDE